MIVRGPRRADNFTILPNEALRDCRLSFRARGVLAFLLSQPEGYAVRSEEIASCGGEGREAIRTALRELEAAGYLKRRRWQDEAGRWCWEAVLFDEPSPETPAPGNAGEAPPAETDKSAGQPPPQEPSAGCPGAKDQGLLEGLDVKDSHAPPGRGLPAHSMHRSHPFWQKRAGLLSTLTELGAPADLFDPDFLLACRTATEASEVYWDDALLRYVRWWLLQPPGHRHRNRQRGFRAWLSKDIARADWRKESSNGRAG